MFKRTAIFYGRSEIVKKPQLQETGAFFVLF